MSWKDRSAWGDEVCGRCRAGNTQGRRCRRAPGRSQHGHASFFFFPTKKIACWILGTFFFFLEEGYRESLGVKGRKESIGCTWRSLQSQKHRCPEYHLLDLDPASCLPFPHRHPLWTWKGTAIARPGLMSLPSQSSTRGMDICRAPMCWLLRVLELS